VPIGRRTARASGHTGSTRRRAARSDRERADRDPTAIEDLEERGEAATPLAEQVRGRDACAVEQGSPVRGVQPELVLNRPTENPGVSAGTMNALISALPSSRVPVRAVTT
jgi:hypothetical protein